MRLGIGSYTYVWAVGVPGYPPPAEPMTTAILLRTAVELGVRVVQIADNLPLHRLNTPDLEALAGQANKAGISLEVGTAGIEPGHLREYLRLAIKLKSALVRVVIDTADHHPAPDEIVTILRPVMPAFEQAGVCLAVENHDRFPAATLATILDRVNSPCIGICLDTANSIGCLENLETVLGALAHRVVNLHVKDFAVFRPPHLKGFIVEGRPAGQGQLDVPRLLNRLRAAGRDPNVIVELWPPPEPTTAAAVAKEAAWAKESVRYLRQFIPD
jgi:sugar phosphate isomerase/epimerase